MVTKFHNNLKSRTSAGVIGLFFVSTTSCGRIDREPHYDQPKDYGRTQIIAHDISDSVGDNEVSDLSGTMTQPTLVPTTDPDTVIASVLFRGAVDPDSFRFLTSGGTRLNPWEVTGSGYARSYFDGPQNIQLYGKQTYGDEATGVSHLIQEGVSATADMGVYFGGESESGKQILERLVGNDTIDGACPTAAVCIRSMLWIPTTGETRTYCYSDFATGEPTLFPYAPAPNFPAKDARNAAGAYGPYMVKRFPGKVDCSNRDTSILPTSQQAVFVRFLFNPKPKMTYRVRTTNPIQPDYSVRVLVEKYATNRPRDQKPYLDDLTRLQSDSEYFINSDRQMLLKVIKSSHKTINYPGDSSIWGRLVRGYNAVSPIVGITMRVHAELCTDYTSEIEVNDCDPTAASTGLTTEVTIP